MDGAIADLLGDLNTRAFKRLPGSRLRPTKARSPRPKPLPVSRYEFARYYEARVNIDYHIAIEDHFYSVPHALVHQKVEVRATARSLEILFRGARVAAHERALPALPTRPYPNIARCASRASGVVPGTTDPLGRAARGGLWRR